MTQNQHPSEPEDPAGQRSPGLLYDALSRLRPIFILPRDHVPEEVIIPAIASCDRPSVMMGFFSSASFAEIAPGLATFLKTSNETLRLIISPFVSSEDQDALRKGDANEDELAIKLFEQLLPDADALARHTLSCLAWLIASGRLVIKIALMKDALFHPKVWIFEQAETCAVLHGSANMTGSGLRKNREQLSLARSWLNDQDRETCDELRSEFEALWANADETCTVLSLSQALEQKIVREFKGGAPPQPSEFQMLWRRAHGLRDEGPDVSAMLDAAKDRSFAIPDWLEYRTGEYSHQGEAVDRWQAAGYRGILEMCTGSGKTLTAMVGAYHLYQDVGRLLIVIAAPYNVLVRQWCSEVALFGIRATNLPEAGGLAKRSQLISMARRRLRKNVSDAEALVVSNDTLATPEFIAEIAKFDGPKLLIADECHNLGAANFITSPPQCFHYRLGLSATPVRQYDAEGTDALFDYLGNPCFDFKLEQAIGHCLTPYDYFVTFVELSDDEMLEWRELCDKISRLAWKMESGEPDEQLNSLFRQRRKILETANAKVSALADLVDEFGPRSLKHTLVYATDKYPEQLNQVNALLRQRRVLYHQLTADETGTPGKAHAILDRFQNGELQVLTAKRVLDEGVNVPQIMRAYILASTTVERQWVQRRGRLLRTCKALNKEYATIHDLVALPPESELSGQLDKDAKKIVNSELDRVWEFARLSRNAASTGGSFEAVERMRALVGG